LLSRRTKSDRSAQRKGDASATYDRNAISVNLI
jgi:hypothetical protein